MCMWQETGPTVVSTSDTRAQIHRAGSQERKVDAKWGRSRSGWNPQAWAEAPVGPKFGLIAPDLGDRSLLHVIGPFVPEVSTHTWSRSERNWWLILRGESYCMPSVPFMLVRWMSWSATMCTCAAKWVLLPFCSPNLWELSLWPLLARNL